MKRFDEGHRGMLERADGEWVLYTDHCEAMKRIAAETPRQMVADSEQQRNSVMVDRGALQAAINMLRRDAAEGRHARGELADELSRAPGVVADSAGGASPVMQDQCAKDVFEHGESIGLFDIPKETAQAICAGINAITGARVDWHYVGGRVHMKALAAPAPSASPKQVTASQAALYLPCPICNGVESCDHSFPERQRAASPVAPTGEREAFEAWAKSKGMPLCMSMALTVADLRETNRAWCAWQARALLAAELERPTQAPEKNDAE